MKIAHIVGMLFSSVLVSAAHAQDGAFDTSFGYLGEAWIDVSPGIYDAATKLIRLPSGGFFMAGNCQSTIPSAGTTCAAWLTPTGESAVGFGPARAGVVTFDAFAGWPSDAYSVNDASALPDGRVIVLAPRNGGGSYLALLRADGSALDTSIGNGAGYIAPSFQFNAFRVTPDQKIVAAGATATYPRSIIVARYNSDFKLDTTFGSGGSMTLGFSDGDASAYGVMLQRSGSIAVVGTVEGSANASSNLAIARFTHDGQPDTTFGVNSDGRFESDFSYVYANGVDITEDKKGRLVFAGSVGPQNNGAFASMWLVGRLLGGGAVDPGFNSGHPRIFTIAGSSSAYSPRATSIAMQSDNRIVAAGTMRRLDTASGMYFGLARFNDDGTFDGTFGTGGQSSGDMSTMGTSVQSDYPGSVAIVGGGIVVGGYTQLKSGEDRFSAAKERIDLFFADDFE